MRPIVAGIGLLLALTASPAPAQEPAIIVGQSGWELERFGRLALLRTRTFALGAGDARSGLFLLACGGADRRFSLGLPDPTSFAQAAPSGRLLLAVPGRDPKAFLVAPYAVRPDGSLVLSDESGPTDQGATSRQPIRRLTTILARQPRRLQLILQAGRSRLLRVGDAVPVTLVFTYAPTDAARFASFGADCDAPIP